MQEKIEEAHAAVLKEKEAAKLAIEQAPPKIVEVPVVDTSFAPFFFPGDSHPMRASQVKKWSV